MKKRQDRELPPDRRKGDPVRWHDSRKEVPPPGRAVVTRDETGVHDIALIDHGGLWHFGTVPVSVTTQARDGVSVSWAYFTNFRPTKRRWRS